MNVRREVQLLIVIAAVVLAGCTARESRKLHADPENAAALAPVAPDELPHFEKITSSTPLHVGVTGQPRFQKYKVDLPLDFPSNELTPAEQAEIDRLEREKFTYNYLDLADIKKPNPLVSSAKGGSDAGLNSGIPSVGVLAALPVSTMAGESIPAPQISPPAIVATPSDSNGGANTGLTESTRSALQIAPATQLVTIED